MRTFFTLLISFILCLNLQAQKDITLTFNLRGIHNADLDLVNLGASQQPEVIESKKNVEKTAVFTVPAGLLPSEFYLAVSYRTSPTAESKRSGLSIFLSNYDINYSFNPAYPTRDSIETERFGDEENAVLHSFRKLSLERKQGIKALEQMLVEYDRKDSRFYKAALKEYDKRVKDYNAWVDDFTKGYSPKLFVSHFFFAEKLHAIKFSKSKDEIADWLIGHYFDYVDFSDTMLLRSQTLMGLTNDFVGLFTSRITSQSMADSILTLAGKIACDKASTGHPLVYGWMVDYFYVGYESLGFQQGMKMLEEHIANPRCMTQRKAQIERRLEGMSRLVPGSLAPNFTLQGLDESTFTLQQAVAPSPYILLVFWSADCEHCIKMAMELQNWLSNPDNAQLVSVLGVSLDETETEIERWKEVSAMLPNWVHLRASGGMSSQVALDYALLSTPVMFLLNSQDYTIKAVPVTVGELQKSLEP